MPPVKVTVATGVAAAGVICTLGLVIVRGVSFSRQGLSATMKTQFKPAFPEANLFVVTGVVVGVLALNVAFMPPISSKFGLG